MYSVYVLRSLQDGKRYVGMTQDLDRRIEEHQRGKTSSTRNRRPFILVHQETFQNAEEARTREEYFKTAAGRRRLRKIEEELDRATRPND